MGRAWVVVGCAVCGGTGLGKRPWTLEAQDQRGREAGLRPCWPRVLGPVPFLRQALLSSFTQLPPACWLCLALPLRRPPREVP